MRGIVSYAAGSEALNAPVRKYVLDTHLSVRGSFTSSSSRLSRRKTSRRHAGKERRIRHFRLTRRHLLGGAGAVIAASLAPGREARGTAEGPTKASATATPDLTGQLARYMVAAREQALPAKVMLDAKHRVLDSVAAMVSGSRLPPGELAIRFTRAQGGAKEASVVATDIKTSAINAALANGMFAHADETGDVDPLTKAHPGAGVVPSALAIGEREQRSGMDLLEGVVLGYDVGCRFVIALGHEAIRKGHRGIEAPVGTMGAMAAGASLARFDEPGCGTRSRVPPNRFPDSGAGSRIPITSRRLSTSGGMGARNGVTAVVMVQNGFTGVHDVLSGRHNAMEALSKEPRPEEMLAGLGSRFFVSETGIKTFSVGYPNQAPLDALLTLRRQHALRPDDVERVVVHLPEDGPGIVSNSPMPDVNCQFLIATALVRRRGVVREQPLAELAPISWTV
jgi:2-methylcitrate dehydratase PrpD